MPYRHTENVARRLAARHQAILTAARDAAAEGGMAAVQIAPVAERAGIAAGTVYRYFPSKTELVAALAADLAKHEIAAVAYAAAAAPGPLSALAAALTTFGARALGKPRLVFALIAEPAEPEVDAARSFFRKALADEFERRIRSAVAGRHLPEQDAMLAALALIGTLIEGLIGSLAPGAHEAAQARSRVQEVALFAMRGLGVSDARARGLVVQAAAS